FFLTVLAILCLLSPQHWLQREFFLPVAALPLLLWGHELSCQGYLPFGAAVVIPLAIALLEKTGLIRNTFPAACVTAVLLVVAQTASTQDGFKVPSFQTLERLPRESKFAGLYAPPVYAAYVKEMTREVGPRIADKPTLWICAGGPHSAWGGTSVFS